METTLNEIRDIVLHLQQILTGPGGEAALWVRSTGSCYQNSCNPQAAAQEPGSNS